MTKEKKKYKKRHNRYVSGVGIIGDKAIKQATGIHTFGLFKRSVKRFDDKEAFIEARNKTYGEMKRKPYLKGHELRKKHYKTRRKHIILNGIFKLGVVTQFFGQKNKRK